jgi:serpin B
MKAGEGMIFVLPDKGVSVQDLLSEKDSVQKLFEHSQYNSGQVVWKIPKFKFGTTCKLDNSLQSLGILNAFSRSAADFSGITDKTAFIKNITQRTHMGIDENGVEASAYTEILYTGANICKGKAEMILDRPFIYGITSAKNVLLFVGVCNDPSVQN